MLLPELTPDQLDLFAEFAEQVLQARDRSQDVDQPIAELIAVAHAKGFVVPFDWMGEQERQRGSLEDVTALQQMDVDAFRRNAITHLRLEHFGRGHLKQLLETGYLAALASRARQLSLQLRGTP